MFIWKNFSILIFLFTKFKLRWPFDVVRENLADFSHLLDNSIVGSEDQTFYKYQVEIVLQITFRLGVAWDDFPTYLTLFQTHENLIPFSIYLCIQSSTDSNIHPMYNDIFEELNHDIILRWLQFPDFDIQLYSTKYFLKYISMLFIFNIYVKSIGKLTIIIRWNQKWKNEKVHQWNF